jgi:thiamine phosphate synthase YjbQ (UPF0047 family)
VLVSTFAGYSRRVAVTSIWQPVGHVIEGSGVELGVAVVTTVVGTTCVVVNETVDRTVETTVLPGRVVVSVSVVPGEVIVIV